ncbi:unnamed protein product [Porites lobata]|uniref:VWFA domain-containing protein n=1 Tax=Porites lobata TaxID=104759 RepID=A0ABN8P613_9CNID|nr:unnamed protein product [Porites lobata]
MPPKKGKSKAAAATEVVRSSRFKTLEVDERISIKSFVEKHKLKFATGRGFYQLTKPETIQFHKEIVVRRKSDGKMASGDEVRALLGIAKETVKFKLDKEKLADFDVFVQSTSYNRILLPDTEFLYDTGEKESTAVSDEAVKVDSTATVDTSKKTEPSTSRGAGRGKRKKAEEEATAATKEEIEDREKASSPSKKSKVAASAAAATGGADVKEIVFSFDTTGSMYPCLTQVRKRVEETATRLFREIPGIRIAVFAHGDYQDKSQTYDTKWVDFTSDKKKVCDFIKNVSSTCGYDSDECYELVLRQVREELSWTPDSQRSLVMIGDASPHPPSYHLNTLKIDWRQEAKKLYNEMGVRIYSVQCLNYGGSNTFYRQLAELTCGWHLKLDQFASIVDFLTAICYREQGVEQLEAFETEVKSRSKGSGMNRNLHALFDTLAGRTKSTYSGGTDYGGLEPVNPSRFQILDVDERCDIRTFVEKNDLSFKTGRGFYEFTKPEKISDKKEVVLVDKVSGDMFTGPEACEMIGAGGTARIKPTSFDKWRVFVQSTSYNRVLMPGTGFLYEVDTDR